MTDNYCTRVGHHCGDIRLVNDLDFYGLVSGTVTVPPRLRFRLHGKIAGDLVVQNNALVAIHGNVSGAILNYGGNVRVWGAVGAAQDFGTRKSLARGAAKNAAPARIAVTGKAGSALPARHRVNPATVGKGKARKAGWASWIVPDEDPEIAAESLPHFGIKHGGCCSCRPAAKKLP